MQDHNKLLLILALAIGCSTAPAAAEDFPRQSYEGAPNGVAAPFVGSWSLGFPQPEGTIVAETIIGCDEPVRIEATGDYGVAFTTPAMGAPIAYELSEFEGRTTWFPADASPTVIAVWLTPDSFHYYVTNMGKADWENPQLMQRCPAA